MVSRGRALLVAASLAACILIVSAAAGAASSPGVEWEQTYNIGGNDRGESMQQTADGGYIMTGTSDNRVCLVKADANGSTQWKKTYDINNAKGYSVRQATDGGYIVTGSVRQDGKDKVLLMKAGQDGGQLWNRMYGDSGAGGIEGAGTSVRQISGGGYAMAAQYPYPSTGNSGLYLLIADTTGNLTRSVMIGKNGDIASPSIEQTADGGFIMAATLHTKGAQGIEPDYDIYLIKFNPSGATQWEKTIGGAGSQYCGGDGSVKQTADGGYVIAGENGGAYLAKTDAAGNLIWGKQYKDCARAGSVMPAGDGGYVLACTDAVGKIMIMKTSAAGDEEWREAAAAGEAVTVVKTADGGYAVSGTSGGDLYLLKLKKPAPSPTPTPTPLPIDLSGPITANNSSTDLGQAAPARHSLFSPSLFRSFGLFGDSAGAPSQKSNFMLNFPETPSTGITNTSRGLWGDSFPKITASFGRGGWPFD